MGWLSNLFGGNKANSDGDVRAAFAKIDMMLDDEHFQIGMLPEPVQALIRSKAPVDQKEGATGEFGMSSGNPIPVNGPIGELAYLSKLRTKSGEGLFFHRIGSVGSVDVFEAVSISGSDWFVFFLDMYYPKRSRRAPAGLSISDKPSQFSGFTKFCQGFPYDFAEEKQKNSGSGLNLAYIPLSKADECFRNGTFLERPPVHGAKLALARAELSVVLS